MAASPSSYSRPRASCGDPPMPLCRSRRDNLAPGAVPHGQGIHRTAVARLEQAGSLGVLRFHEYDDAVIRELEGFRSRSHTVAKSHAQRPVDPHPQIADLDVLEIGQLLHALEAKLASGPV